MNVELIAASTVAVVILYTGFTGMQTAIERGKGEADQRKNVRRYRKHRISNTRKVESITKRPYNESYFGLPAWDFKFPDGSCEIVFSKDYPRQAAIYAAI